MVRISEAETVSGLPAVSQEIESSQVPSADEARRDNQSDNQRK